MAVGKQVNDKKGTAVALRDIGNAHRLQGDYAQAVERFQESLKIAEEIGDKNVIAGALNDMGAARGAMGLCAGDGALSKKPGDQRESRRPAGDCVYSEQHSD